MHQMLPNAAAHNWKSNLTNTVRNCDFIENSSTESLFTQTCKLRSFSSKRHNTQVSAVHKTEVTQLTNTFRNENIRNSHPSEC